jgi:hypothetical protein
MDDIVCMLRVKTSQDPRGFEFSLLARNISNTIMQIDMFRLLLFARPVSKHSTKKKSLRKGGACYRNGMHLHTTTTTNQQKQACFDNQRRLCHVVYAQADVGRKRGEVPGRE